MNKKVLLVEDNEMLATIVKNMLLTMGFDVVVALNGQEALDMIPAIKPNLIISDINMPQLDGIELALKAPPSIPFILMTGDPENNIPRLSVLENAGRKIPQVLRKPFSGMSLGLAIVEAFEIA
jgi:CheY-like chemotaxis protein